MGNSRRRKPPLAAPRRTGAGKGRTRRGTARKRSRNPLVWLLRAVLGLVWRLVWGLGWRVGVAVALVIGLAVA
jgi:penicillin-binding protein 1A